MRTPIYVINKPKLIENYNMMKELMYPCDIYYSMKANPHRLIVDILKTQDIGFEISSLQEICSLQDYKIQSTRIYCGIPFLTQTEIRSMSSKGCEMFVFDSEYQWQVLQKYAPNAKKVLRIKVDDIIKGSIAYGMSEKDALSFLAQKERIYGFSFHISDHSDESKDLMVLDRIERLMKYYSSNIHLLNIGGSYTNQKNNDFMKKVNYLKNEYNIQVMCELGNSIVNSAGYILSKCVYVKREDGWCDVLLDGGIPEGIMRRPTKLRNISNSKKLERRRICRFFDTTSMKKLLFQMVLDIEIEVGDILRLDGYGAYSLCYCNDFHSRPKPALVLEE